MSEHTKELLKDFEEPISDKYSDNPKYINRELSWLEFNKRVLIQSIRKDVKLHEQFKFLDITNSNLDEFIMVRLSSVINRVIAEDMKPEISGMNPIEEYSAILKGIKKFKKMQDRCYDRALHQLDKRDISLVKFSKLDKEERGIIGKYFYRNIFPLITPINYDTTKEFPDLISKQLNIVVSLEDKTNPNLQVISFIPINSSIPKIFPIPNKKGKKIKYITLEEILYGFLEKIYFNKKIVDYGMIKILRNSDTSLSHNKDIYITDRMRKSLTDRRYSAPVYMDVTGNISKELMNILTKIFDLDKRHVYSHDSSFDYAPLTEIYLPNESDESFTPQYPSELIGEHDMFSAIDKEDILLHHPYQSFSPVIKFLEHAAYDPDVLSIRQTLYRVSSIDSPIVNNLCLAAENGKSVSVILEIKARFDEDRNISMIDKMKSAGVHLIYGDENLKTHCKFITVVRRHKDSLKIYSHIGTGNYNDKTAKLYTDISLFTSNYKIGQDLMSIFNMLSGFADPTAKINKLFFSPYNLRKKIMSMIDNEIKNVKDGKLGIITLKMNSISDKEMIDKLYEASKQGVKIMIFCRGICSMKPINKNIEIRSLVGRFLEHSRIYSFYNDKKHDIFISSADLLTRNLDKRFELLVPVKHKETKSKLLKILSMYYTDTFNTFSMSSKGKYEKVKGNCNIHELFMKEAIENYKLKSIPKMIGIKKK